MSLSTSRQEIADALSTVDDVNGSKYRTKVMNVGDAWPLIESMERGPALDFAVTWKVIVMLPRDERSAMEWYEDHYEALAEALETLGYVERIEPGEILTEAGSRDGMILTLIKEA